MRFPIILCLAVLTLSSPLLSQTYPEPLLLPGQSEISGGMGISWIDGTPFYMIGVLPNLSFGNIGIGLDLTLRMNTTTGAIRRADWAGGAYRKIIRYISWGKKHDPVFAKIGQLDGATLGHGFIMYDYTNSPSYDNRTIGGELDLDFSRYGFEAMYGNFHEPGVMGGRAYVRPLEFTDIGSAPTIGGIEIGATYLTDQNDNSNVTLVRNEGVDSTSPFSPERNGTLSEYGFEVGLPIVRTKEIGSDLYYDYAQINHYGHGSAIGIMGNFSGAGLLIMSVKLERQFTGEKFIPEYFDHFYELERYVPGAGPGYISKAGLLDSTSSSQGWFGQLAVSLTSDFRILGAFRSVDNDPQGGLLHIEADLPELIPQFAFSAGYDRVGTLSFSNIFTLNNKSLVYAFFGYKPYPFMKIGVNYFWTYYLVNGEYVVQRRMEPSVMVDFLF